MQIYRNASRPRVSIVVPDFVTPIGETIDIRAVDHAGQVLHVFAKVVRVQNGFSVQLPWSLVREDNDFFVIWNFDFMEEGVVKHLNEHVEVHVVTPILPLEEIAKITGWEDNDEVVNLERHVRFAINAYTGTTFNKFRGTIPIHGTGDTKLQLPLPLLELTAPSGLAIFGGGMMLGAPQGGYAGGIKSAPPEEVLDHYYSGAGPIVAPYTYKRIHFRDDVEYRIKGIWGYHHVPADVQQAARLLVADYSCDESLWRDRYINAMRAGDWRIDFNGEAFQGTGNVTADQILAAYRRTSLVVI